MTAPHVLGHLGAPQGRWVGPAARSHPTTLASNRVAGGTRPASAPGAKARLRLCQAVGPWVGAAGQGPWLSRLWEARTQPFCGLSGAGAENALRVLTLNG